MFIYLYKNSLGHITAFQSHIEHPNMWPRDNLRQIPDESYSPLFYFLTGRRHVKETDSFPTAEFGEVKLKDEGDLDLQSLKDTKKIFSTKF